MEWNGATLNGRSSQTKCALSSAHFVCDQRTSGGTDMHYAWEWDGLGCIVFAVA